MKEKLEDLLRKHVYGRTSDIIEQRLEEVIDWCGSHVGMVSLAYRHGTMP